MSTEIKSLTPYALEQLYFEVIAQMDFLDIARERYDDEFDFRECEEWSKGKIIKIIFHLTHNDEILSALRESLDRFHNCWCDDGGVLVREWHAALRRQRHRKQLTELKTQTQKQDERKNRIS
jgi:hypothetical protein